MEAGPVYQGQPFLCVFDALTAAAVWVLGSVQVLAQDPCRIEISLAQPGDGAFFQIGA